MPSIRDLQGNQLYFDDVGQGWPMIWIHPPGMGRKAFTYQHPLASDYRLIMPDLSGHGDSDVREKKPSIDFYVQEINHLLTTLNISHAILCGYSCGGSIVMEFALQYPQKVKALVLSGGFPKVATWRLRKEFHLGMYCLEKSPELLAQMLCTSHFSEQLVRDNVRHHILKADPDVWYHFYKECLHHDCTDRLTELTMPILLLYGGRSNWINAHARYFRVCENARMVVIDDSFHQLPATHWHTFNSAIKQFASTL
ncbi:alpha/beta fold hydrolase [Thalassobacillus sp. CUG 92003]|uniref:alpha/beta fold hydrolase n=1 Tax=Thalassobacillus sp. CUG 92003 TaxID=2736641 RepID=UPI0015E76A76|nr:alpha/beta hydrolase [Thalassobacillus sp. CUG 92003]